MKWIVILSVAVLAGAVFWVGFNQVRLERRLAELQAQHQHLEEELASRASANPEAAREAQRRLEQTQLALAQAEQRLSSLTARMEGVQPHLQTSPQFSKPLGPIPSFSTIEPHAPASSHSPTGELLTRNWGPEQALGPPNTTAAGDLPTAWAARAPDDGEEWLKLEYERAIDLAEVRVRESFNPGAISKVTAVLPNGQEVTIWEGEEPPGQAPLDTAFPVNTPIRSSSVKVYLDTRRVPGWNEIDAVELVGRDGSRQWATSATASSTFAHP